MRTIVLATALLASLQCARPSSDFSALAQCAASWSSYDAFTSSAVIYVSSQNTTYFPVTTNITSGTGQVYTTSEGIPVASGSFTPTKVVQTVYTVTSWDPAESTITNDPAQFSATPSCPSIAPSDCSNLYVSYLSSLGISGNATVPLITPAPTNSPRCPEYYYRPFSSCSYFTEDVETCFLSGANVQVFYFPPKSDVQNGSITSQVIQSYAPGITFTSPSIYLSFDYLSAFSTIAATQSICTSCGWDGCSAVGVGGGNGLETRGTSIAGALLTLAPEDVSTLLVSFPQAQISSVVQQIAQGGPDFANLADDINYNNGFMARRLNLEHFQHPSPEDYYLRPEGAPGCNNSVPSPECSTIFEGMHRPILSLPSQVSLLQGAWSTCQPAIYGVYDPPRALTEESTVEGVSDYGVFTTIVPSHHHITTPPQPSTPWEAVAPPTHIPGTDHSVLSDNLHSPTPTSANETPNSPTGTGTSIAAGLVEDHYAALVIALIGVMILL